MIHQTISLQSLTSTTSLPTPCCATKLGSHGWLRRGAYKPQPATTATTTVVQPLPWKKAGRRRASGQTRELLTSQTRLVGRSISWLLGPQQILELVMGRCRRGHWIEWSPWLLQLFGSYLSNPIVVMITISSPGFDFWSCFTRLSNVHSSFFPFIVSIELSVWWWIVSKEINSHIWSPYQMRSLNVLLVIQH